MLKNSDEIYKKITSNDKDILSLSLDYIKEIIQIEKERIKSTEMKATTLLGFTGLVASFILSFGKFLFDLKESINLYVYFILIIIYLLTTSFLFSTIWNALEALKIKTYYHGFNVNNIFEFQLNNDVELLKNWTTTLIFEFNSNNEIINTKVYKLKQAQNYFAYSIILLLISAFVISFYALWPIIDP